MSELLGKWVVWLDDVGAGFIGQETPDSKETKPFAFRMTLSWHKAKKFETYQAAEEWIAQFPAPECFTIRNTAQLPPPPDWER